MIYSLQIIVKRYVCDKKKEKKSYAILNHLFIRTKKM